MIKRRLVRSNRLIKLLNQVDIMHKKGGKICGAVCTSSVEWCMPVMIIATSKVHFQIFLTQSPPKLSTFWKTVPSEKKDLWEDSKSQGKCIQLWFSDKPHSTILPTVFIANIFYYLSKTCLRWLKIVSSSLILTGHYNHSWSHFSHFRDTIGYHSSSLSS